MLTDMQIKSLAKILYRARRRTAQLKAIEKQIDGLRLEPLKIDILNEVLDVVGFPPAEVTSRGWLYQKWLRVPEHFASVEKYLRWANEECRRLTLHYN